ncbi:tetratricopeptide repeat 28-like [Paramuricea clavata]|uniref:Tetratricopeptide repeat 28-like n=1 Tax=Paramuricea clavata TaxID=317549 RepID=A0A7D9IXW9_PARCT|nr:tetratricopeptide repeat 28-like [Paramuricea clavata]
MASKKIIAKYEKCLQTCISNRDPLGIAKNNDHLGDLYATLGENGMAIQNYEKSLQIYTQVSHSSGMLESNTKLGNTYLSLAEYEEAITYYKMSLEISTRIGLRSVVANSNCRLCVAYRCKGNYKEAITYGKNGLEISTAIGFRSGIASNATNLGIVYRCIGEYWKAIDYCKKGLEISTSIGDRSGIASNIGNLGNAYRCLGEYQKAIDYYKNGAEISTDIGDRSGMASYNGNLGNAYLSLGEYQKAIHYYKKSLEISTAIGNRSRIAGSNGNLGNAYRYLGEYHKAMDYNKNGLEISTAIGDQSAMANNNHNLGNVYHCLGDYQKAIDFFKKGLKISTALGDRPGIASINCNLGRSYGCLGDYHKAIDYFEKGLEINTATGNRSERAIILSNLGNTHRCLGEYEVARSLLVESISLFDRIFLDLVPDENKLSFTKQYFESHRGLMSCFVSLERIESALLVIDLGRAKELHCCVEKHKNFVNKDMFDYARAIWNRIEAKEERRKMKEMQTSLHLGKNDTSILLFAFNSKDSLIFLVLNDEVIFRKLDACLETLVSLIMELLERVKVSVHRNSSFCNFNPVVDSHNQIIFPFELPDRKPLSKNAFENTACSNDLSNREILEILFKLLVYPVKDLVNGNKLIIVPDEQLFFTPFSALIDENGSYLSNSYSVQITPSLHTLMCTMEESCDSNFGFALFVGNPTVGKVSLNGEDLTPCGLPSAAEEVKCLSKLFQATPLLGRAATKEVVLQLLNGASIIHIAAHGEPNRGEIMLAPNSSRVQPCLTVPTPESYLLTQRDILNMSVQARLVVLCCCHTGQGEITSEGVIGITRAFLAAGARCVLATLWPIDDNATKEFMEKFYSELCQETPVCEALRRTMNLFQKHEIEVYRSVRIWGPFTVYGEDVKFNKNEIEQIREKSREMFSGFVVL